MKEYLQSKESVMSRQGVTSCGLTSAQAASRLEKNGKNKLAEGKKAFAIIKASNVMFAAGSEPIKNISARNQLVGTIISIKEGAVNGHVALELADGNKVIGSITNEAIESLGLAEGEKAVAIIKSTDVMVGVE